MASSYAYSDPRSEDGTILSSPEGPTYPNGPHGTYALSVNPQAQSFGAPLVTPVSTLPSKPKQCKNACAGCARASKKCDDGRPCRRCIKYNMEELCKDRNKKSRKGIKRGSYNLKKRDPKGKSTGAALSGPNTLSQVLPSPQTTTSCSLEKQTATWFASAGGFPNVAGPSLAHLSSIADPLSSHSAVDSEILQKVTELSSTMKRLESRLSTTANTLLQHGKLVQDAITRLDNFSKGSHQLTRMENLSRTSALNVQFQRVETSLFELAIAIGLAVKGSISEIENEVYAHESIVEASVPPSGNSQTMFGTMCRRSSL